MQTAPFIGIVRHRMKTDGFGVTTLAAFGSCPLRCKYCLNPHSLTENKTWVYYTPEELFEIVKPDNLYFLATNGGITFGGGEPLLRSKFIKEFHEIANPLWSYNFETSLNVDREHLDDVLTFATKFIVDIKDMNPEIYEKYTGKDNKQVLENIEYLCTKGFQDKITVRIPLIPGFNTDEDRELSEKKIKSYGITDIDKFQYIYRNNKSVGK